MIKEQTIVKKDTQENWDKAIRFVPKAGEMIYYTDIDDFKIGDGKTLLQDLVFLKNYSYAVNNETLVLKGGQQWQLK